MGLKLTLSGIEYVEFRFLVCGFKFTGRCDRGHQHVGLGLLVCGIGFTNM